MSKTKEHSYSKTEKGDVVLMAHEITKLGRMRIYLCDLAMTAGGEAYPEQCQACVSQCAYGRRWLEMLEEADTQ